MGRTIGDRYEVGELISVGGMGRVHRGLQRSLDRAVAIKFIHPHLLTSPDAVSRFMTEARAASRLNHPHVVSVFDFGRTAPDEGGDLFIVMELLSGSDLHRIVTHEGALEAPRVVEILRQTLLALSEAHHAGITHRDIKPENVFLEQFRGDLDHVKVIDFGIASVNGRQRITQVGKVMGTPAYMAPEQIMGLEVGPRADLYAVGVMLFELLTGRLPFDAPTPQQVIQQHLHARRPDPRDVAPERAIPASLAQVCMRAIDADPARRFADARDMTIALLAALPSRAKRTSLPPPTIDGAKRDERSIPVRPRDPQQTLDELVLETAASAAELEWARAWMKRPGEVRAVVFYSRTGVGRSQLLRAMGAAAAREGALVVEAPVQPLPQCEVSFAALRTLISQLVGLAPDDPQLVEGRLSGDHDVREGLCTVFGGRAVHAAGATASEIRTLTAAALAWAVQRALGRAGRGAVLLLIDDVDCMDGASFAALGALLRGHPRERLFVAMSSEHAPGRDLGSWVTARELHGATRVEAQRVLEGVGGGHVLTRVDDDIEPLYLDHVRRWTSERREEPPPVTLAELLEARVQALGSDERRVLQCVAVAGAVREGAFGALVPEAHGVEAALATLEQRGFVRIEGGRVVLAHPAVGQAVLASVPSGARCELHARVADSLAEAPELVELRAFHALRGAADFAAFVLVEAAARRRAARGDDDGAIELLSDAIHAARIQLGRGDVDAASSACAVFSRKLSAALLEAGRVDQAYGVLAEMLGLSVRRDSSRALILEQLAIVARKRGQHAEAERNWRESLSIAEVTGDRALATRLRMPIPELSVVPPEQAAFPRPFRPGVGG